jgi:hypothetical protein
VNCQFEIEVAANGATAKLTARGEADAASARLEWNADGIGHTLVVDGTGNRVRLSTAGENAYTLTLFEGGGTLRVGGVGELDAEAVLVQYVFSPPAFRLGLAYRLCGTHIDVTISGRPLIQTKN